MLSPLALVFGMDHPGYKEPWNYGDDALRNFKKYDSLRYSLLPYLYSNAYQLYKTGMPLMRALVLNYQNDENVYNITDQYLLGDNLMVCPVTTKGAQTRVVYLPKGNWFNYWTGKQMEGGRYWNVLTPLDSLPLFVKAGSIIPSQPVMSYVGEKAVDAITLDVYPGPSTTFDLYEDDGKSLAYQQGAFALTKITSASAGNSYTISINKPAGKFTPPVHGYKIQLHLPKAPNSITENGKTAKWNYDAAKQVVYIKTAGDNKGDITIKMN
jgi:alpha-glucosidase (family GH31 glycosyl hydrolase)